jgi:hypothetical protein
MIFFSPTSILPTHTDHKNYVNKTHGHTSFVDRLLVLKNVSCMIVSTSCRICSRLALEYNTKVYALWFVYTLWLFVALILNVWVWVLHLNPCMFWFVHFLFKFWSKLMYMLLDCSFLDPLKLLFLCICQAAGLTRGASGHYRVRRGSCFSARHSRRVGRGWEKSIGSSMTRPESDLTRPMIRNNLNSIHLRNGKPKKIALNLQCRRIHRNYVTQPSKPQPTADSTWTLNMMQYSMTTTSIIYP